MKKLISKINQYNFRDVAPYASFKIKEFIFNKVTTLIGRCYCLWWRVTLGSNCYFFGIPLLRKHPSCEITIGNSCIFRSAERTNTIGINHKCFISAKRQAKIIIGKNCGFSSTTIAATKNISIGSQVLCGANVTITDSDRHPLEYLERRDGKDAQSRPVVIEDDVWLGMNVVVLKGVTIGKATVVATNSVVVKDLPSGVLAGGIPAKVIRKL